VKLLCVCGKPFEVDDARAGDPAECPHCGREMRVPSFDDDSHDRPEWPGEGQDESGGFADQVREAMKKKIIVTCGSCGRGLSVSMDLAGKGARCPACGSVLRIPELSKQDEQKLAGFLAAGYELEQEPQTQIEILDELASAVESAGRHHRMPPKRAWLPWILAAAVLALGMGLGIGYLLVPSDEVDESIFADGGDGDEDGGGSDVPSVVPTTGRRPVKPPVKPSNGPPKVIKPTVKVQGVKPDIFASGGYFPARPGWIYWQVRVVARAGSAPLAFRTRGEDLMLSVGKHQVRPLGSVAAAGVFPARAQDQLISVRPRRSATVELLFEVPVTATVGTLFVGDLPGVAVGPVKPFAIPKPAAIVGNYVEVGPRNLKPLLRNPVMAAVQGAATARMNIGARGSEFRLWFHDINVGGTLKARANGEYEAYLRLHRETLNCKFRLMDDGYLIVYLADGPFHQLTFLRQGAKKRPMPGALFVR